MVVDRADRIAGAIYGMALGDSWGYPTEFMGHGEILRRKPAPPIPLRVTDDTQMSLYNVEALRRIYSSQLDLSALGTDTGLQNLVRRIFADQHLNFEIDRDNNRAPGNTVMGALSRYRRSSQLTGLEGSSQNNSKGCGTVMRAPWLGMLPVDRQAVINLAILQSETTHGHPVAALASATVAILLKEIFEGTYRPIEADARNRVVAALYRSLEAVTEIQASSSSLVESARFKEGVREFREMIYEVLQGLEETEHDELENPEANICYWFGEGWIGDEALLCAIGALAIYGERSFQGIERLVFSSGDSDSIAAVGGSLLGALNGYSSLASQADSSGHRIIGAFEPRYEHELSEAVRFFSDLQATRSQQ